MAERPMNEQTTARPPRTRCPAGFHKTVCGRCGKCQCWHHDHFFAPVRANTYGPLAPARASVRPKEPS